MTITGKSLVYVLVADPVEHVRTPELYNSMFAERGLDVVVVPVHVRPEGLEEALRFFRSWCNLAGIGVTIPHKERMPKLVDELTPEATRCEASNVVRRDRDGRLVGTQMDGPGFAWSLFSAGHEVSERSALVVGAGGTARAIAFELADRGVRHLHLANRTIQRARHLADDLRRSFPELHVEAESEPAGRFDLIINATSLGMHPDDPLPMDRDLIHPGVLVADVVMRPQWTRLLTEAAARGCETHHGIRMLESQFDATVDFLGLVARPSTDTGSGADS